MLQLQYSSPLNCLSLFCVDVLLELTGSGLIFPCDLVLEMFWSTICVCVEGMCVDGQWVGCSTSHFHLNATWFCDLCDATWPKYSNPHGSLMLERTASVDFWTYKHALHACVWNNLLSLQERLLDHKRWSRLVFNLSWSTETWCWEWKKREKSHEYQTDKNALCVFMAGPLRLHKGVNESHCACHNSRSASISPSTELFLLFSLINDENSS